MTAVSLTRAVAAHGIAGSAARLEHPLSDEVWSEFEEHIASEVLWTSLREAMREEVFATTSRQREIVELGARACLATDVMIEAGLFRTGSLLRDAAIPFLVLKGPAVAHRFYAQPSSRSFRDLDVLVPGDRFDESAALLESLGGLRSYAEARPGFDRRFSKGASFAMPNDLMIDLHRTLVLGPYGFLVDLEGLFERQDSFHLGPHDFPALEANDAFLHACFHAALGDWPPRLTPLRDVAQLLSAGGIDQEVVLARARTWNVQGVVASAVEEVLRTLPVSLDGPIVRWAGSYRRRRWERWTLSLYTEGRSYQRQALAAVPFVPGLRAKVVYAANLAFPADDYLAERESGYVRRLGVATRTLVDSFSARVRS